MSVDEFLNNLLDGCEDVGQAIELTPVEVIQPIDSEEILANLDRAFSKPQVSQIDRVVKVVDRAVESFVHKSPLWFNWTKTDFGWVRC